MSKGNTTEIDILKLYYQAVAIADIAENDGSSPETLIDIALHSADPGEAGTQATNELSYTGYARLTETRNATQFPVVSNHIENLAVQTFGKNTDVSAQTALYWSTGYGAGIIIHKGPLGASSFIGEGIVDAGDVTADTVQIPAHGLAQDDNDLELIVFDAANLKIDDFDLTPLITDAKKSLSPSTGLLVANKAIVTVLPTGSSGNYWWHVVGSTAAAPTVFWQLGQPATIGYYPGPPSS